jgi:hypothetical protein
MLSRRLFLCSLVSLTPARASHTDKNHSHPTPKATMSDSHPLAQFYKIEMRRDRRWTQWDSYVHYFCSTFTPNRFDCPRCTARDTFRAYGGGDVHRRWLCKYCGYYFGAPARPGDDPTCEGEYQCYPNEAGMWSGDGPGKMPTPMEKIWPVWPWR